MAVLPTGIGPVTGYNVERSLRFNSADSAYLNRTPSGATNQNLWTFSCWLKLGSLGTSISLWSAGNASNSYSDFGFSADRLYWYNTQGGVDRGQIYTASVLRDPSAWYHIVFIFNGTTPSVSFYVNGVLQTTTVTTAQAVASSYQNGAVAHNIGRNAPTASQYFNGYLTEVNFIDGSAKTPSNFGETDASTGVWKPKAYTGTYGTNGFFLKFADNSNTTAATLGKDSSGNGNNWTPNNFSVTAGAGNDSLVDSPTSYGTDTGAGGEVRGNYCTWDQLNKQTSTTISNGALTFNCTSGTAYNTGTGTIAVSSGKWYWEITATSAGNDGQIGILAATRNLAAAGTNAATGTWSDGYAYGKNGNKVNNGSGSAYGATWTTNDVIGVAYDADNGKLFFRKNGTWQNSGDPVAGTGAAFTGLSGFYKPSVGNFSETYDANFGQRPFAYTAPSGFKALCTQNLPTPTIGATSTTQANDYFNAVLYTGNSSTQTISGVGFQPDLVWVKNRSSAGQHVLTDVLRGTDRQLFSSLTNAEQTSSTGLTAFTSDGFSLGANPSPTGSMNGSPDTYVAWNWKANGAGVTNTAGTITSTVSASTTSGFSIVTYTGNGTGTPTIGHGLGVAPSMVIAKTRSTANGWLVYHKSLGATQSIILNGTNAATTQTDWGNTTPTSTVFYVNGGNTNISAATYVAYCFAPVAGYSAFGSYTGNGSTDGPFVYTGFRPRYIMLKKSSQASTTYGWQLYDTSRSPYNQALLPGLWADTSAAEVADVYGIDILSNGFKVKDSNTNLNASGQTIIYAAFAEHPFKYSLAR